MSSKIENVMIIEGEHEIYLNGIAMEEVVEGSLQIENRRANGNKIVKIACLKDNVESS
jgi:DNA-directed RNA polymerase subunit K/omega